MGCTMASVFCFITSDDCQDQQIVLRGERFHHLVHVRRLRLGTSLQAVLPDGRGLLATVTEISAHSLQATVTAECPPVGISPCRLTLYQSVLKGEKMDLVIQKATELGVDTIIPLCAQRSIPRWTPAQARERTERWQRIALAAAEQCERSLAVSIQCPCTLAESLHNNTPVRLLLHERQGMALRAIVERYPAPTAAALFVGPEGGWEDAEVQALLTAGVEPVHLGSRILRAETASVAALAVLQYLWGDLGTGSLEG